MRIVRSSNAGNGGGSPWSRIALRPFLAGRADHTMMLERLERPLPASWEEQRALIRDLWPM